MGLQVLRAVCTYAVEQGKLALDAAHGVPGSSMVTAMSRNGVEFGIRVSGLGHRWSTAPAGEIDGERAVTEV